MNYNILAYAMYLGIMVYIIVYVGRLFHRNGRVFIIDLFRGDAVQADHLNDLLLVAYCLFNIGYAFLKLRFWTKISSFAELVSSLSTNIGLLILILAVTHYFNIGLVHYLSSRKNFIHHK